MLLKKYFELLSKFTKLKYDSIILSIFPSLIGLSIPLIFSKNVRIIVSHYFDFNNPWTSISNILSVLWFLMAPWLIFKGYNSILDYFDNKALYKNDIDRISLSDYFRKFLLSNWHFVFGTIFSSFVGYVIFVYFNENIWFLCLFVIISLIASVGFQGIFVFSFGLRKFINKSPVFFHSHYDKMGGYEELLKLIVKINLFFSSGLLVLPTALLIISDNTENIIVITLVSIYVFCILFNLIFALIILSRFIAKNKKKVLETAFEKLKTYSPDEISKDIKNYFAYNYLYQTDYLIASQIEFLSLKNILRIFTTMLPIIYSVIRFLIQNSIL